MLPDYRMRFPATRIDFTADVGETGQDHDNYPTAGQQPRYDWMRMVVISLLSNQASYSEPSEKRIGSLWFDLNNLAMKVWIENATGDGAWELLSEAIALGSTTLADWYTEVESIVAASAPSITFGGSSSTDGATEIIIPESIRSYVNTNRNKPFVFKNGLLIDPRNCQLLSNTTVRLLNGNVLDSGDTFFVELKNVSVFHVPNATTTT